MLRPVLLCLLTLASIVSPSTVPAAKPVARYDMVVYGATPSGIAASVSTARRDPDARIALITPYRRIGGMITNGLTHPDFRTFEARTGLFRELNQRVESHYRTTFGRDSQQVRDSLQGTHAGPEVNFLIVSQMLEELPGIEVLTEHRLIDATTAERRVMEVRLQRAGQTVTLAGDYFVDASYEGDLMAAAGVPFRIGREAKSAYGESLAPEEADEQIQGYNFRLTMTDLLANQAPVPRPQGYRRDDYLGLLPLLESGSLPHIFGDPYSGIRGGIYKRQTPRLPNGKRDINDVSRSIVRLSMPDINNAWPNGDAATRQRIFDEHVRHNVGMLYFLQHDESVPQQFREEARSWGLCRDELTFNQHLPEQLYVREARRMVGRDVFTQRDTERAPGSHHARAIFHTDAVAMGDYGPNCHGTDHEGPRFGGRHTGEFYKASAPYQIPYGTLLPPKLTNLAVPVACSASHVGFCALRLEPIWMSLGQAAGEAIGLAREGNRPLPEIAPAAIRERLHDARTATIYTSDVPEESADFRAVQWWGSHGGFVALDRTAQDPPADYGRRGPQRIGQYHQAFPEHAVQLDQPLTPRIRTAWLELARSIAPRAERLEQAKTRGEFIREAWRKR